MKSVIDPVAGDLYQSTDYETLEGRAQGARHASESDASASSTPGVDEVLYFSGASGLLDATANLIDDEHDWRQRVAYVRCVQLGSAGVRPKGGSSYADYGTLTQSGQVGWFGDGAYSNVAGAGTAVSNGAAPLAATGGVTSYRLTVLASTYLYVSPTTGALYLYNATGGTIHVLLAVKAFGALA